MKLSGEEEKIQALFSELKAAEVEDAPRFAGVWNRAAVKSRRTRTFNPAFVAAIALVVCAVISLAIWSRFRQPTQTPPVAGVGTPETRDVGSTTVPVTEETTAAAADPSNKEVMPRRKRVARRNSTQLAANRKLTKDAKAITDWESPTSALLSSPSDSLFSSLPQLNEHATGLQSYLPNRPK